LRIVVAGRLDHYVARWASLLAGLSANWKKPEMDSHTLWEDADSEISILKQAKAEYAQNRVELSR